MSWGDLCLRRSRNFAGDLVVRFGVALLDGYLEFLAVRSRSRPKHLKNGRVRGQRETTEPLDLPGELPRSRSVEVRGACPGGPERRRRIHPTPVLVGIGA
jgi:hypothetical protein